ncbi:MAG TPA: ribokinase [Candidatus Limnocylindrales bacterium]|nr:ribokinase [Candidatus Limnocylindrales bacterium]
MSGRVIVVGSVNVDLVVRAEHLPAPGETVTGGSFEQHHGGKGGNQAVAAARLGRPTLFVGAVGDDAFAAEARSALAAEHVDTSRLLTIPETATGVAIIMVDDRGENLIGVASGANARLEPGMVAEAIERLGPLEGDIVMACNEVPTDSVREGLRVGRAAGATTVLNPAPAPGLGPDDLALADVVTPNRTELAMLVAGESARSGSGEPPPGDPVKAAVWLLQRVAARGGSIPAIVVTLGRAGAVIVRLDDTAAGGATTVALPAPPVETIDSTGAGDAFNGALAVALAEGRSLEDAVTRAVAAGALATVRVGAREGMPSAATLRSFLGVPEEPPPIATPPEAGAAEPTPRPEDPGPEATSGPPA